MMNDVPDHLYSEGLLTDSTHQLTTNVGLSDLDKGREFLFEIQDLVKYKPKTFETFCKVLEDNGHDCGDLVGDLRGICEAAYESLSKKSNTIFDSLKEDLQRCQNDLAKEGAPKEPIEELIRYKISSFIEERLSAGGTKEEIDDELYDICYESFLVPLNLCDSVLAQTKGIIFKQKVSPPEAPEDDEVVKEKPPSEPFQPMPCSDFKDVLYHSSLCCHAVTSCPDSYPDFFSKSGHHFDEMSMSLSDSLQRCLIAIKGDTMYVAFRSEADLADWMDVKGGYKSFTCGLEKQSSQISYAFFFEHLERGKKLVFTGFSFGGMLACYVTATLWNESYIPVPYLEKNVVCVTYGQPLIKVSLVQEVMTCYDHFQDTVYQVYAREDIFPRVLRYFSMKQHIMTPLSSSANTDTASSSAAEDDLGGSQEFCQPFPQQFLGHLSVLQKEEMSYSAMVRTTSSTSALSKDAVQKLQTMLDSIPKVDIDCDVLPGRYCYLTSGLKRKWTEFPSKEHAANMLHQLPDQFDANDLKKHSMRGYITSVQEGFLYAEPDKYTRPPCSTKDVPKVGLLKPAVTAADIHVYENEHAVVLEGENLSFCHAVRLGEKMDVLRIDTPALITSRMIRFNYPPNNKTSQIAVRKSDETMRVELHSHFSKRLAQRVKVKTENFLFSVRQIQVAKYTPAEVIQLAFMTALLERHSHSPEKHKASDRVKTIANFLQEAVKVVPLESVFYAISSLDDDNNARECANAVISSKITFSTSSHLQAAANLAAVRMGTGMKEQEFNDIVRQAMPGFNTVQFNPVLESVTFPAPHCVNIRYCQSVRYASYSAATQNLSFIPGQIVINTPDGPRSPVLKSDVRLQFGKERPLFPKVAEQLQSIARSRASATDFQYCKLSIEHIYPVDSCRRHTMTTSTLESPREILHNARKNLQMLLETSQDESDSSQHLSNENMLEQVRDIYEHKLKICASLLAAFMESQIHIPLIKESSLSTANFLSANSSPVAVGVWTLFSRTFQDLQGMLAFARGNPLLIKIADYISGVLGDGIKKSSTRSSKYDGKLQFLLQGFCTKTITSSMEYVSYSLEHQLCNNLKFDKMISVSRLVDEWDKIFKGDALCLVAKSHRYITARWLKWAVLIHDLRSALAKYICIGVTGLVNSGKSQLVKKLFGVETRVGTCRKTRTTIPLLYNLDGIVDGLDVVDFPGVDDKEHNIPKLAELLLRLAQVVVFVCDYRRISTDKAKEWIAQLERCDVPVVVCLTFADNLYTEFIDSETDNGDPNPSENKRRLIKRELEHIKSDLGHHVSREVDFYCFNVPGSYRKEINAQSLAEVGIGSPLEVGDELVKIFRKKFKQENVAKQLRDHVLSLRSQGPASPK